MSTLLAADLLAACSALGHNNGSRYYPDEQCLETAKDLMRFLRRDDETFEMRRLLGNSQVLQSDLLPLMKETSNQPEYFDIALRLMVNLTSPALMLYKEILPKDKIERNYFLQIIGHLQQYKHAFAEDRYQVWDVIREKMNEILQIEVGERDEDQSVLIERCLILVRNMLNVPTDSNEEKRPDNDANLHDKLLWSLHTSGIKMIILYLASNKTEHAYYMYVLEIMSLMLREQNPEVLSSAHFNRSEHEKERDEKALAEVSAAEQKIKLMKLKSAAGSRHSRFGGSFTVRGMKAIGNEDLVLHRPLKSSKCDNIDFDLDKKSRKTPKNKLPNIEESCERRSAFTIRLMLKEFCVEFLSGAYNHLMSTVKGMLDRQAAQANDETYYLWGIKFFMQFNRHYGFKVELVSETMNVAMFHFISMQVGNCRENMTTDKPRAKLWAARLHVAIRAYGELLLTLCAMDRDPNASVRNSSKIFKSNIFYLAEYREILLSLMIDYNELKFSDRFLKDLVESVHVFLKLLEGFCTTRSLLLVETVRKKQVKKKKKPVPPPVKPKEDQWAEIYPVLTELVGRIEIAPGEYCPFDATLDKDIEDQKADAMCRVQTLLRKRRLQEAVGTLRAAREVWPENDIFGTADMTADEEVAAMHDIFQANIQLDAPPTPPPAEDESEEEEDAGSPQFVLSERSFDFNDFVSRFAHEHVIRNCGLLLKRFATNTVLTNHCVCKLLHRIAFNLKQPVMLFQVSLFMTFQKILRSDDRRHKELAQFVRFVVQQLKIVAEKNPTIFREMLFWTSRRIAEHILTGDEKAPSHGSKLKQAWAEEEEDELHRLHEEYIVSRPTCDLSTWILKNLVRQDRTKTSVNKKLREFGYLAAVPGSKRSNGPGAPVEWAREEETELEEHYEQYKNSPDPISMIMLAMTVHRGKKDIIDKLLSLGLITNKNQVEKKRDETDMKMQYKSAEFVEDDDTSSSDDDNEPAANSNLPWPEQLTQIKRCSNLCKEMDGFESLVWLVQQLKAEAEERRSSMDDPDDCDSLLLPDVTEISAQFETDQFKDLFTSMGLVQDVFLKIPAKMSPRKLVDMAAEIQKALSPAGEAELNSVQGADSDSHSEGGRAAVNMANTQANNEEGYSDNGVDSDSSDKSERQAAVSPATKLANGKKVNSICNRDSDSSDESESVATVRRTTKRPNHKKVNTTRGAGSDLSDESVATVKRALKRARVSDESSGSEDNNQTPKGLNISGSRLASTGSSPKHNEGVGSIRGADSDSNDQIDSIVKKKRTTKRSRVMASSSEDEQNEPSATQVRETDSDSDT